MNNITIKARYTGHVTTDKGIYVLNVDAGKVSFPTKYGKFKIGTGNIGGAKGVKMQFDLDTSILGKLEKMQKRDSDRDLLPI